MDFEPSTRAKDYRDRVRAFVRDEIAPLEPSMLDEIHRTAPGDDFRAWRIPAALEELKQTLTSR